ncbi:hypothetical protein BDR04DRAFT_1145192 [Suillus decipiens]|nr:hypothetical protein BDR04DRAFT_1145192 [Suillus decipiens]
MAIFVISPATAALMIVIMIPLRHHTADRPLEKDSRETEELIRRAIQTMEEYPLGSLVIIKTHVHVNCHCTHQNADLRRDRWTQFKGSRKVYKLEKKSVFLPV